MKTIRSTGPLTQTTIDESLLKNAKEFLRQWLMRRAPDAFLTHQWERFHEVYSQTVRCMARGFRLSVEEIEDISQEVWSEVCTRLPPVGEQPASAASHLRAWLYRLVHNKAIDCIRRRGRRRETAAGYEAVLALVDPRPGPADQWEVTWDRELLHLVVDELRAEVSPENHRFLTMRLIEGRSLDETAEVMNVPKHRLKDRQKYLLRKVRGKLRLYRGEPLQPADRSPRR